MNTLDSYKIQLDIEQSDKTKKNIAALKDAFKDTSKTLTDINNQFYESIEGQEDITKEAKAYNSLLNSRLATLTKEQDKLNENLISNQRQIDALKEQQKIRQLTEQELRKLAKLEDVQARLRSQEEINKQKRTEIELQKEVLRNNVENLKEQKKLREEEAKKLEIAEKAREEELRRKKLLEEEFKRRNSLKNLIKEDLKGITDRIKKQKEFIQSLKTTEGRYNAIKKAAALGAKGAKMAGKAALGVAGIAGAAIGGAMSSADNLAQKEHESRRIRAGLSSEDRLALMDEIYVKTGADSASIVNAINRVYTNLKTSDKGKLAAAAVQEVRYPGSSALIQSQTSSADGRDYSVLGARMRAIQSVTGASGSAMESAAGFVSNRMGGDFKNGIAQTDLIALYSALQGTNAYDDEAGIEKAMQMFLRQGDLTSANFYEKMKTFDWSKTVYGEQNRNQARHAMESLDVIALQAGATTLNTSEKRTGADSAAEAARKLMMKKDELLMKILNSINVDEVVKLIESLMNLVMKILPPILKIMQPVLKKLVDFLNLIMEAASRSDGLKSFFENLSNVAHEKRMQEIAEQTEEIKKQREAIEAQIKQKKFEIEYYKAQEELPEVLKKMANVFIKTSTPITEGGGLTISGGQKASGGIALSPTIVGERGAEAIIPLDFARRGRANNIMTNITQNFNMSANQTTALSLGQAVKQRSFTDNFISARMYGG